MFAAILAALVHSGALDDVEAVTSWNVAILAFAGIFGAAGFVAGRWWALWLVPLGWLTFVPGGSDEQLALALVICVPAAILGVSVGVALRRMLGYRSSDE